MYFNIKDTLCFTGHRPNKLYGYNKDNPGNEKVINLIKNAIIYSIKELNIKNFISGMALGVDQWAALEVIKLKQTYPNIKLITAIPCIDQPDAWPKESQDIWEYIFYNADINHYVYERKYFANCLHRRNEWMVNHSVGQIAVWNGDRKGGTYNCIKYADKRHKKSRIIINPNNFTMEVHL